MSPAESSLLRHLLRRLNQVRQSLGLPALSEGGDCRFADALDSMGLVEFVALLADDCGVPVDAIEEAVGRRFSNLADLARALSTAGLFPSGQQTGVERAGRPVETADRLPPLWLAATTCQLPEAIQSSRELDGLLRRPPGWLEEHAGIQQRHIWTEEDIFEVAGQAGKDCLTRAGINRAEVGALLVTSEAPPVLTGLAAGLHQRLGLPAEAVALEIGGACTGFLACLWTAQRLLIGMSAVLVLAVEAPSRWLRVQPGLAGEAAALFGDAVAAAVVCGRPVGSSPLSFQEINLGADGSAGSLLRVHWSPEQGAEVVMDGPALAGRAVQTMAEAAGTLLQRRGMELRQVAAIVVHGGNGRLPALLARQLGVEESRVWSETPRTGNLGSASLPAAWASRGPVPGAVLWLAAGAGLVWGAALAGESL